MLSYPVEFTSLLLVLHRLANQTLRRKNKVRLKHLFKYFLIRQLRMQVILHPWGHDRLDHAGEMEWSRLGRVAAAAATRRYRVGSSAKVIHK